MKGILALLLLCAASQFAAGSSFSATHGLLGTNLLGIVVGVLSITAPSGSEYLQSREDEEEIDTTKLQTKFFLDMVNSYGGSMKENLCRKMCLETLNGIAFEGPPKKSTEFATPNSPVYKYYEVEPDSEKVIFKVNAANDAYIALTHSFTDKDPRYEVRIGTSSNSQTFIAKDRSGTSVATTATPGILSKENFREFWIKWDDGTIRLGRGGEKRALLAFADPNLFEVKYLGFSTRSSEQGHWEVQGLEKQAQ